VIIAAFFAGDADLPLLYLPKPPVNAFADQVVWIAGASSGIGAALAADMVRGGATVIISARRVNQLNKVADDCSKYGKRPIVIEMDMTDNNSIQKAFDEVMKTVGRVDSLVLNAGQSQRIIALDTPFEVTEKIMKLNFLSYVALTTLVAPTMVSRNQGQIVVVSSLSGIIATPAGSSYSASKFALHGYFDALRAEVAGNNVSVSLVCPGPVESEIAEKAHRNPNNPTQDEGKKMPTERCTELMAKGMYHRVEEIWISHQPFLLFTYVSQYMPRVSRVLAKILGPARVKALKEGTNLYDTNAALGLK